MLLSILVRPGWRSRNVAVTIGKREAFRTMLMQQQRRLSLSGSKRQDQYDERSSSSIRFILFISSHSQRSFCHPTITTKSQLTSCNNNNYYPVVSDGFLTTDGKRRVLTLDYSAKNAIGSRSVIATVCVVMVKLWPFVSSLARVTRSTL